MASAALAGDWPHASVLELPDETAYTTPAAMARPRASSSDKRKGKGKGKTNDNNIQATSTLNAPQSQRKMGAKGKEAKTESALHLLSASLADISLSDELRSEYKPFLERIEGEMKKAKLEPNPHDAYIHAKNAADNLTKKLANALDSCNAALEQLQDAVMYHRNTEKELAEANSKVEHFAAKARLELERPAGSSEAFSLSTEDVHDNEAIQNLIYILQQRQMHNDERRASAEAIAVDVDSTEEASESRRCGPDSEAWGEAAGAIPAADAAEDFSKTLGSLEVYIAKANKKPRVSPNSDSICTTIVDEQGSFSYLMKNPLGLPATDIYVNKIIDGIPWQQLETSKGNKLPRKTCWFTTGDCSCQYNYGNTTSDANPFPNWLSDLTDRAWAALKSAGINAQLPNSCNANLYENGRHHVGWH